MIPQPEIQKSSRHSKITGDFAEAMILYWLSKHGFECAMVDHTGIDVIAARPSSKERLGISIKSRSRVAGTFTSAVNIDIDHLAKCRVACEAFGCDPYYAIVVDAGQRIDAFIAPQEAFLEYAPASMSKCSWKMSDEWKRKYASDPRVMAFEMEYRTSNWWKK